MKFYAGIGSRTTPVEELNLMTTIARRLSERYYTLRSGGADGADTAFARGADSMEIFVPWHDFGSCEHARYYVEFWTPEAEEIAAKYHPAWHRCSPRARSLHTRNVAQVLGQNLETPSEFVICYTEGGRAGGGTGQAIRIANAYGVPVYDLGAPDGIRKTVTLIENL